MGHLEVNPYKKFIAEMFALPNLEKAPIAAKVLLGLAHNILNALLHGKV